MKNIIIVIITSIILSACSPIQSTKPIVPFDVKTEELNKSLFSCNNLNDSLITLRQFAHTTYRTGTKDVYIKKEDNDIAWQWNAKKWYQKFSNDSLAVYCGGAANYLVSTYEEFGFLAYSVSIGSKNMNDTRGHVQVLVTPNNGNLPTLENTYIMDPMFNSHYVNEKNQLLSLSDHLQLLLNNDEEKIKLVEVTSNAKYLTNRRIIRNNHPIYNKNSDCFLTKSRNPKAKYLINCPRTLQNFLDQGFQKTYQEIAQEYGLILQFQNAQDFKYTPLCFRAFYGKEYTEKLFDEYNLIIKNNIQQ